MSDHASELSFDEFDELNDPRDEPTGFERILSRRHFLGGATALSVASAFFGLGALRPTHAASSLGFEPVVANSLDTVTVPLGFSWHNVVAWGDPLWSDGQPFDHATRGTGVSQERAFGDNNDGMSSFFVDGRTVLAINNEYVNRSIIYGNRASGLPENADDIRKGKAGHGVSIFEIERVEGAWRPVIDSPLQLAHHRRYADGDHRPRARPRPAEDNGRCDRNNGARHLEQLRQWQNTLGHLSHL